MKSIKFNYIILTLVLNSFTREAFSADQFNLEIFNFKCVKNTLEFDLYGKNGGINNLHLAALSCGINLNKEMLNGGSLVTRISTLNQNMKASSNLKLNMIYVEVEGRIQIKIASEVLSYLSSVQFLPNSEIYIAHATIYNSVDWNKKEISQAYIQLSYQLGLASAQAIVYTESSQESKVLSMMTDDLYATFNSSKGKIVNSTISEISKDSSPENSDSGFALFTYPNPVTDLLNIHLETNSRTESIEICITDILGRNLDCQNLKPQEVVDKQLQIPSTLSNGSYFIQLITDGKVRIQQKLVLSRN